MPANAYRTKFASWGRYPVVDGLARSSENLASISRGAALTRGCGRSYGDASLPATPDDVIADATRADRLLSFDPDSGVLRAEAGLTLRDLHRMFLHRQWYVPVAPGTQFVTLGGMVASDVHGKNHHADGSFGEYVRRFWIRVADGRIIECSDAAERDLFRATIGGMGLTGHILEVEFAMRRLPSPWIWQESERLPNLDAMIAGLKDAADQWEMTVGWIDGFAPHAYVGRGILMKGRWASADEAPRRMPGNQRSLRVPLFPFRWTLGRPTMKIANSLHYWRHLPARRRGIVHPQKFLFPLDRLEGWNRVYGRHGFAQYQCVLPLAADNGPVHRFFARFLSGTRPYLCVIKDCGRQGKGILSFPRPGISLALDFPIVPRATQGFVDQLNETVIAEGGRIYLAKDAFTRPEHFRAMEPRLVAFQAVRRQWDPRGMIRSALSVRMLDDARP